MNETERSLKELLASLKPYNTELVEKNYIEALKNDDTKVIVLDDDPTGIQTVHDIYVYTDWKKDTIVEAFNDPNKMSFVLTNSRGLTAEETEKAHKEMAESIVYAAEKTGKKYAVISRSDSTLRGHYPLETAVLEKSLTDTSFDGEIIMPYFLEGGRYTAGDVHYVANGDVLVPAGNTEFAKDKTFGYKSSNLKEWVCEKTNGRVKASEVVSVSLDELRNLDYQSIENKLMGLENFSKMIVNTVSEEDVKVFVTCLFRTLAKGKHYIYRSAAALAKVMGGVESRPLLTSEELRDSESENGGIIVVGSHVNKTTRQLEVLKTRKDISFIEINQHLVVDDQAFKKEMDRVISTAEDNIKKGLTTAVYTRRERFDLNNGNKEDELRLAVKISDAVTSVVARLKVRPSFIIAKGGITSSEIGTKALRCRKALAAGQILKGIPVWKTGEESLFPGMHYIIFPGNVGDDNALRDAVEKVKK